MRQLLCLAIVCGLAAVAGAEEVTLKIKGMSCPDGCVKRVEGALAKVEGVKKKEVELGQAKVSYDAKKTDQKALVAAVEKAGYTVEK